MLRSLSERGFQLFHTHQNPLSTWEDIGQPQRTACCFELSFLNARFGAPAAAAAA